MKEEKFQFKLKGKTLVCIDWANVYGWQENLDWKISADKLIKYLLSYKGIFKVNFYFGTDITKESQDFISSLQKKEEKEERFSVITKEVKYVPVDLDKSYLRLRVNNIKKIILAMDLKKQNIDGLHIKELENLLSQPLQRRKCDFDIEIALDVFRNLENFDSFILFSGDGDYKPLVQYCIENKKQTIIVAQPGSLGKEYRIIPIGLYICNVRKLRDFISK
jgi:uncharacterized LabA/DUF88 family protein